MIQASAVGFTLFFTLQGCIYDDLPPCPPEDGERFVVRQDWSEAEAVTPGFAMPEGVTVQLYADGSARWWRFLTPPDGGEVDVPDGRYSIATFNNDTHDIIMTGNESFATLTAYTTEGSLLSPAGKSYEGGAEPPRHNPEESVRREPELLYAGTAECELNSGHREVTIAEHRLTGIYSMRVTGVTHSEGIAGLSMSLSGLSGARRIADGERVGNPVTIAGHLKVADTGTLEGRLQNFGPAGGEVTHTLSVYVWLRDGSKIAFGYDVTGQITAGRLDLDIEVAGMELPEVEDPDIGGMDVGIDNWENVDIELTN